MLTTIRIFIKSTGHFLIRYLVIVILSVITLILLVPSLQWGITWLTNRYGDNIVIGLKIKEITEEDYKNITLPHWQQAFKTNLEIPLLLVSVDYIYVPKSSMVEGKSLCIDELTLRSIAPTGKETESVLITNNDLDKICLGSGKNFIIQDTIEGGTENQVFIFNSSTDPFWYPFDKRTLIFNLQLRAFYIDKAADKNEFTVNPAVEIQTIPPHWFSDVILTKNLHNEEVKVVLSRPPLYLVLSVLMPIGILLIQLLLIKYRQEIEGFWEVVVGLIFGLWGLSEVLIPNYINFPTFIGSVLLLLFIPLGLFVAHDVWLYFIGEKPISSKG